jgi:hypothetical protein
MPNKKKTLDDFLKKGKTPPTKGKKAPADYDVVDKSMGYKKTTKKNPLPTKIKKSK